MIILNNTIACKLFVWDRNSWYYVNALIKKQLHKNVSLKLYNSNSSILFVVDGNTWCHIKWIIRIQNSYLKL